MLHMILDNIPKSALGPLTDEGKVIGVIVIALALGIALRKFAHRPIHTPADCVDVGLQVLIQILHWIIEIVPFAVFGLVASIIGVQGFAAFHALGIFVLAVILALLIQSAYYLTRIRLGSWVRPLYLLKNTKDALVMAFSTGSSTATMPLTFECLRNRVGLRERSASLGSLVGANFNNDGTALYEAMAALFHRAAPRSTRSRRGTDYHPATPRRPHIGHRLGRRRGNPRSRPCDDDSRLQRRRSADRIHRASPPGGLVSRPLPHSHQRHGRHERELPDRRPYPEGRGRGLETPRFRGLYSAAGGVRLFPRALPQALLFPGGRFPGRIPRCSLPRVRRPRRSRQATSIPSSARAATATLSRATAPFGMVQLSPDTGTEGWGLVFRLPLLGQVHHGLQPHPPQRHGLR